MYYRRRFKKAFSRRRSFSRSRYRSGRGGLRRNSFKFIRSPRRRFVRRGFIY